jgi:hypothetical protein
MAASALYHSLKAAFDKTFLTIKDTTFTVATN